MALDIHAIMEIKTDGKWSYVDGTATVISNFCYMIDRDDVMIKGLPKDVSGLKFDFRSETPWHKKRYETGKIKCLLDENNEIHFLNSDEDGFYLRAKQNITKAEYDYYVKLLSEHNSRQFANPEQHFCWNYTEYSIINAALVNAKIVMMPLKKIYKSLAEFQQANCSSQWNEFANDYGEYAIDFTDPKYKCFSSLTLSELDNLYYGCKDVRRVIKDLSVSYNKSYDDIRIVFAFEN